jgi:hypothetical protein
MDSPRTLSRQVTRVFHRGLLKVAPRPPHGTSVLRGWAVPMGDPACLSYSPTLRPASSCPFLARAQIGLPDAQAACVLLAL